MKESHKWNHLLFVGKIKFHHFCQPCFGPLPRGRDNDNHLTAPAVQFLRRFREKNKRNNATINNHKYQLIYTTIVYNVFYKHVLFLTLFTSCLPHKI